MSSVYNPQPVLAFPLSQIHYKSLKSSKYANLCFELKPPNIHLRHIQVFCSKLNPWEQPSPLTYTPVDEADHEIMDGSPISTSQESDEKKLALVGQKTKESTESRNKEPHAGLSLFFKWSLWLLGPSVLLTTGMVPTLWLSLPSVFLGPNIASLLSLVGLDCIFNIGATLFLLMAHSCAWPNEPLKGEQTNKSKASKSYRLWNTVASIAGYAIPLALLFSSQKGFIQPQLSPISFLVLFGPYLLLLSVQMLTEMLTWHWGSPVWLVVPVVYEAYRVLQLMRSLKLGSELSVAGWTMETLRVLVCWWVVILGVQLMRVAWFVGFSARVNQQQGSSNFNGG